MSALEHEIEFKTLYCFTDSKVALCWIRGLEKDWKLFFQNRVREIRKLVLIEYWHHCPGKENPTDIPSRGTTSVELERNVLWRHGSSWLFNLTEVPEEETIISETCLEELKLSQSNEIHSLLS